MDVIVDGEKGFEIEGDPADVLAVVGAVSSYLEERGRAIVGLTVDGKTFHADNPSPLLMEQSLDTVNIIEVTSAAVVDLVESCLQELEEALRDLPSACHELAKIFHGDHPDEGYGPFEKLAEVWELVKARELLVIRALDLTTDDLELDGRKLSQLHEELNGFLQESAEALSKNDCVSLGDLLAYELAPRAEQEAGIVKLLVEQARERSDTA